MATSRTQRGPQDRDMEERLENHGEKPPRQERLRLMENRFFELNRQREEERRNDISVTPLSRCEQLIPTRDEPRIIQACTTRAPQRLVAAVPCQGKFTTERKEMKGQESVQQSEEQRQREQLYIKDDQNEEETLLREAAYEFRIGIRVIHQQQGYRWQATSLRRHEELLAGDKQEMQTEVKEQQSGEFRQTDGRQREEQRQREEEQRQREAQEQALEQMQRNQSGEDHSDETQRDRGQSGEEELQSGAEELQSLLEPLNDWMNLPHDLVEELQILAEKLQSLKKPNLISNHIIKETLLELQEWISEDDESQDIISDVQSFRDQLHSQIEEGETLHQEQLYVRQEMIILFDGFIHLMKEVAGFVCLEEVRMLKKELGERLEEQHVDYLTDELLHPLLDKILHQVKKIICQNEELFCQIEILRNRTIEILSEKNINSQRVNDEVLVLKKLDGQVLPTNDGCCICMDGGQNEWRAKMTCGHVLCVSCMTQFARTALEDGLSSFLCCICKGEKKVSEWSYRAIRHVMAHGLTECKLSNFDQKLNENGLRNETEIAHCPQCKSMCQRSDTQLVNVQRLPNRVICGLCAANGSGHAAFCWSCGKTWANNLSSTSCGNAGCDGMNQQERKNRDLEKCGAKDIFDAKNCPELRACVRCNFLINHVNNCKHVVCPRCGCNFCFVCLKPQLQGYQGKVRYTKWPCGKAFDICPVAPRQIIQSRKKPPTAPKPHVAQSAITPWLIKTE